MFESQFIVEGANSFWQRIPGSDQQTRTIVALAIANF